MVDSKLRATLASPTLSGGKLAPHRHSLSQPRAMPATGPHAQAMPTFSATMTRARPVRHTRHTPTDRAPPSPRARVITNTPATPQTRPFAAARTTRAVRHQNFRRTSSEHRSIPTDQHRPTPLHHDVELRQGAQHHPLPSPTPISLCTVDHDELSLHPSVPSRHY